MVMQVIESIKDTRVVETRLLGAARGRYQAKKCLLFGLRQIQWAHDAGLIVEHVFMTYHQAKDLLVPHFESQNIPVFEVSPGIMKKISGTRDLVPVIGVARTYDVMKKHGAEKSSILVLDNVVNHSSLGAMIRSARDFGIYDCVITDDAVRDVFYRRLIGASEGTVFSGRTRTYNDPYHAVDSLKNGGYQIVAVTDAAPARGTFFDIEHSHVALVMSGEGRSIRQSYIDAADIIIPVPALPASLYNSVRKTREHNVNLSVLRLRVLLALMSGQAEKKKVEKSGYVALTLTRFFQQELSKLTDLSMAHIFFLIQLLSDRVMTLESVVKNYVWNSSLVKDFIAPLMAKGLVEFLMQPLFEGVRITLRGEQFLERALLVFEFVEELVQKNFTHAEKDQLGCLFQRMMKNVDSYASVG